MQASHVVTVQQRGSPEGRFWGPRFHQSRPAGGWFFGGEFSGNKKGLQGRCLPKCGWEEIQV